MTLAVAHREGEVAVVDAVREARPPFSPESVVEELAGVLHSYRISRVQGDRYGGLWPTEAFARYGIRYEPAAKPKSDLYRDMLPLVNSGRVELLDHQKLAAQLVGLERRTSRGGRDSIDHPSGGHDDIANCAAGALVAALGVGIKKKRIVAGFGPLPGETGSDIVSNDPELERSSRDDMARLVARTHERLERQAARDWEITKGTADTPMISQPVWFVHERGEN
jgi:hypothetical protein